MKLGMGREEGRNSKRLVYCASKGIRNGSGESMCMSELEDCILIWQYMSERWRYSIYLPQRKETEERGRRSFSLCCCCCCCSYYNNKTIKDHHTNQTIFSCPNPTGRNSQPLTVAVRNPRAGGAQHGISGTPPWATGHDRVRGQRARVARELVLARARTPRRHQGHAPAGRLGSHPGVP
jgi:hypothetical protein